VVGVAVAPLVLGSLRLDGGQRDGLLVLPQGHHGQVRGAGVHNLAGRHVFGLDAHSDLHRSSPGGVDGRSERDDVAEFGVALGKLDYEGPVAAQVSFDHTRGVNLGIPR